MSYTYDGLTDIGGSAPVSCFYDSDRNLVGYFKQATGKNNLVIPDGATQVKFSIKTVDLENFSVLAIPNINISEITTNINNINNEVININNEIIDINNDLNDLHSLIILFDPSSDIGQTGQYLTQTGQFANSELWCISKYIIIDKNMTYQYNGLTTIGTNSYSCFYDSNKIFLSSFKQQTGENILTIPDNAKYIKFSIHNVDINSFSLIGFSQTSINEI